jgi:uncharacterized protein YndB with AHSA1/START domain
MTTVQKNAIVKDLNEKSILVSREFEAPLADVWRAYTESDLLDQWWGPSPWHVETKQMNFKPGGYWLYAMCGPQGEKHWARMDYLAVDHHKSFDVQDSFCDENGNINRDFPSPKEEAHSLKQRKAQESISNSFTQQLNNYRRLSKWDLSKELRCAWISWTYCSKEFREIRIHHICLFTAETPRRKALYNLCALAPQR